MLAKGRLCLLAIFFIIQYYSFSQTSNSIRIKHGKVLITADTIIKIKNDTIVDLPIGVNYLIKKDKVLKSERFYRKLKRKAYKNKWSKLLYDVMTVEFDTSHYHHHTVDDFLQFEGLKIHSINFKQVDVWVGSVLDTSYSSSNWFVDFSNKTHYGTREKVLNNNLLFNVGENANAYHFSDNERLIRQLPYIEDARIYVRKNDLGGVDVDVVTKDLYSYGTRLDMHGIDKYDWRLFDRNFLGYGNTFSNSLISAYNQSPKYGYQGFFTHNNIRGSFIDGKLLYRNAYDKKESYFKVDRQFITPETKWGGAIETEYLDSRDSLFRGTDSLKLLSFRKGENVFWIGPSINLGKETSRDNLTFITSLNEVNYFRNPNSIFARKQDYRSEFYILNSVIYTHRGYVKDRMINRFGITEDIPVGFLIGFTKGYVWKDFYEYAYTGFEGKAAFVSKNKYGINFDIKAGISNRNNLYEDKVFKINTQLFSPLFCIGKIKYRSFLKGGYHRATDIFENSRTQIGDKSGVRGLRELDSDAHSRFLLNYDQIIFTPWYIGGFKLAPYVFADAAYLRSRVVNEVLSGYGFGFRLRNESLVIRTVHFRLGYHPQISDLQHNRFSFSFSFDDAPRFLDIRPRKPERIRMN